VFKVCIDAFVFVLHTCKLVCLSRVFNKLLTYLLTYLTFESFVKIINILSVFL